LRALAAVALSLALATCSSPPSVLERILRTGELRVVTRNTPAAFYYGADEPRGVEYELARGFAERLGVGLRIYIADQVFPDLASGKAHVAAASLTVADARKDTITFGPAYQDIQPQVIYRLGTKRPRTLADLRSGRLEIAADSSHTTLLNALRGDEPLLTWIEESQSSEELLRRVADGEINYTIADSHLFALLRHFYPDLRVAFSLGPQNQVAWALPKDAETLRENIAAYFAEIEATGELGQILDRYYFASRDFDYVGSRAFIRHVTTRLPRYRDAFLDAERTTGTDWRLLAAMAYQESHWNPGAISPTGVRGIMMLTEHTAEMMEVEDRHDARASIIGGARYYQRVLRKVPERIADPDRSWLAVAAYNLGYGHVEDARILTQHQGADPDDWEQVRERLPLLSDQQWHRRVQRGYAPGHVAVTYVDNVRRYYEILMWMDSRETFTSEQTPSAPYGVPIG
jgi:peptidoglycan lytic transglycosylase F